MSPTKINKAVLTSAVEAGLDLGSEAGVIYKLPVTPGRKPGSGVGGVHSQSQNWARSWNPVKDLW